MNVYEAILSRKTVRDFDKKEIDSTTLRRILDAGLHAPSNDHMRQWHFIVMNDVEARIKAIAKVNKNFTSDIAKSIIDDWGLTDEVQRNMYIDAIPKQYSMLVTAPCLVIPFFYQPYPLLNPSELSSLNGFASIWCCIENILISAASEGIFGVTRIPFDEEIKHLKSITNIPSDYEIPCYLALGYPKQAADSIVQHSINVDDRIHFNKW